MRPPADAAELQKTISNSFFEDVGCSQTASKFKQMSEVVSYFLKEQMIKIGWPSFPIFSPWYLWRTFQRYLNVRDSSKERRKIRSQTFHTSLESKEIRKCFITKKCSVSRSCKAIWVSDNSNAWRPCNKSSHRQEKHIQQVESHLSLGLLRIAITKEQI